MMKHFLILSSLSVIAGFATASEIHVGDPLPAVHILQRGELLLNNNGEEYQPWSTDLAKGRIVLLEYLSGHPSSKGLYQPLNEALETLGPDENRFHVAAIVNLDDALFGTKKLVIDQVVARKQRYPRASFVIDENALGQRLWGIPNKSGALILLDESGVVRFYEQGALEEDEINQLLLKISTLMGKASPP